MIGNRRFRVEPPGGWSDLGTDYGEKVGNGGYNEMPKQMPHERVVTLIPNIHNRDRCE